MKITYIDLLLWTILCSIHITHTAAIFLPPPSTASPLLVENTQTDCHQQSNGKNKPSPWVSSHHSESLVSFQYWPVSSATTQISWKCDNLCWNIRSDHCFCSFFPYLINSKFSLSLAGPWKASSISAIIGVGLFLSRAYMDMTIPGVQKPHWEPWAFAIRSWMMKKNSH